MVCMKKAPEVLIAYTRKQTHGNKSVINAVPPEEPSDIGISKEILEVLSNMRDIVF